MLLAINTFSALGHLKTSLEKMHRACLDIPERPCNSCNVLGAKNVLAMTALEHVCRNGT